MELYIFQLVFATFESTKIASPCPHKQATLTIHLTRHDKTYDATLLYIFFPYLKMG
ncbi:hypothetical protein HanIR_Chr09g0435281 [Helianthus annuus]|nr:hypothetical protein HanIR_Chr09g0435281 [Helianthus annuus]